MTTSTGPRATVTPSGTGYGPPLVDTREVPLDLYTDTDVDDITTGMKTFSPQQARIVYRRAFSDGAWSPWRVHVHITGPRRLSSGALSDRSKVTVTLREDAAESSVYAVPDYVRPHIEAWRPAGDR